MLNCPNCGHIIHLADQICSNCGCILSPVDELLTPGKVLQKRYEIQKLLHIGGMGYIYSAKDKKLYDRVCIVKQVKQPVGSDKITLDKLQEEARRMSKISHPDIANIYDHFVENDFYFIVVEYISGQNLNEVKKKFDTKIEIEVIKWAISICKAVGYLHQQNVLHRDISPDNIMLTDQGNIKLIDFGTLREFQHITSKGTSGVGKFGFTPPEQWEGHPVPQSDVFAIGATIYHLLTSYLPLSEKYTTDHEPQEQDFKPKFPSIRSINPAISPIIEEILNKALQLDISKRYLSIEKFERDLEKVLVSLQAAEKDNTLGHRQSCLAYYYKEVHCKTIQENAADIYNSALSRYGGSMGYSGSVPDELIKATQTLVASADDILNYRKSIEHVPDDAAHVFLAWNLTYYDYSAWANAQFDTIFALSEGRLPFGNRVKELLEISEKSRKKAEREEKRFIQKLKITPDAINQLIKNVGGNLNTDGLIHLSTISQSTSANLQTNNLLTVLISSILLLIIWGLSSLFISADWLLTVVNIGLFIASIIFIGWNLFTYFRNYMHYIVAAIISIVIWFIVVMVIPPLIIAVLTIR